MQGHLAQQINTELHRHTGILGGSTEVKFRALCEFLAKAIHQLMLGVQLFQFYLQIQHGFFLGRLLVHLRAPVCPEKH